MFTFPAYKMAFLEAYRSFLQETIENPEPLEVEHFFLEGLGDLWYLFLDPIMSSYDRLKLVSPNFPRFVNRLVILSTTLEEPLGPSPYDFLINVRAGITRELVHDEFAFFLQDLGYIFQETQQQILSAQTRRVLNVRCSSLMGKLDDLYARYNNRLNLLSE